MPEFRGGTTMHIQYIYSGGTITLQDQFRSVTISSEQDTLDSTAGTVAWREFIAGLTQWNADYEGLHNGASTPLGTADIANLRRASGTLYISPFGTSSGNQKITGAAIVTTVESEFPYDDVVTTNVSWQGSGTLTETVW